MSYTHPIFKPLRLDLSGRGIEGDLNQFGTDISGEVMFCFINGTLVMQ